MKKSAYFRIHGLLKILVALTGMVFLFAFGSRLLFPEPGDMEKITLGGVSPDSGMIKALMLALLMSFLTFCYFLLNGYRQFKGQGPAYRWMFFASIPVVVLMLMLFLTLLLSAVAGGFSFSGLLILLLIALFLYLAVNEIFFQFRKPPPSGEIQEDGENSNEDIQ